jgi:hypothetical protein
MSSLNERIDFTSWLLWSASTRPYGQRSHTSLHGHQDRRFGGHLKVTLGEQYLKHIQRTLLVLWLERKPPGRLRHAERVPDVYHLRLVACQFTPKDVPREVEPPMILSDEWQQ